MSEQAPINKNSMPVIPVSNKLFWAVLGGILSLATILLIVAPAEQTLGEGIKSVYIHVAFTWAGMIGLVVAGILGLATAITDHKALLDWAKTIGWVALAMFAAGLVMSILAARINWGAVFWQEPRTNSAFEILALGFIVQFMATLPIPDRLKGVLFLLLAAFLIYSVSSTERVLHPGNAARTSPSATIRFTFLGLFLLFSGAAAWIIFHKQRGKRQVPR
jgi:hypothetical protein